MAAKYQIASVLLLLLVLSTTDHSYGWLFSSTTQDTEVTPIVIIPGTGASQLWAKLDRDEVIASHCDKTSDWFALWLNVWELVWGHLDCWVDNIKLIYNPETGESKNTAGVETRVPGFGDTDTIEYLDPSWLAQRTGVAGYANKLVKELVSWGHTRGKSVRGAPYDFRYAPHSQHQFMSDLKNLIEETFQINGNKKVALFAHSLGGSFGLYFLNQQSQQWKDTYIHSFISVGTPYGGSSMVHVTMVSGLNWGVTFADPLLLRRQQRTYETNVEMLLKPDVWGEDVIVETPEKKYRAADTEQFFKDIGFPVGNDMNKHFNTSAYARVHPGVQFHCIHSNGHQTPEVYKYTAPLNTDPQPKEITYGDGDSTVNYRSLESCKQMDKPGHFTHALIPNAEHTALLSDSRLFEQLKDILQ